MAEISSTGDQMLTVLEAVATDGPCSAADLSKSLAMNRTVVHRLLTTLHARAYVRRDRDGAYLVGPTVMHLAGNVEVDLMRAALGSLEGLAERTGETAIIHVLDGDQAVVLHQALGTKHVVRVDHEPGSRHPLSLGASGRAMLAFLPGGDELVASSAEPEFLRRQLGEVRQLGYAVSHDELQRGVHGVAVPIRDGAGAAHASLAIVVPTSRADSVSRYVDDLLEARSSIEAALGVPSDADDPAQVAGTA